MRLKLYVKINATHTIVAFKSKCSTLCILLNFFCYALANNERNKVFIAIFLFCLNLFCNFILVEKLQTSIENYYFDKLVKFCLQFTCAYSNFGFIIYLDKPELLKLIVIIQ